MIMESLYSQFDPDGNEYILLDEIVDHRYTDLAIKLADQKVVRANGWTYLRRSTIGRQLCCQWKDGSSSWVNLADRKEYPIEVAKYAKFLALTMNQLAGVVCGARVGGAKTLKLLHY